MSKFKAYFECIIEKDFFEDDLSFHEAEVRIRQQPYLRIGKLDFVNNGFKIKGIFSRPVVAYFFDILSDLGVSNIQAVYNLYEDLDSWYYECGLKDDVFYKKNFVFSGTELRELLLELYKKDVAEFDLFISNVSEYISTFSFNEVSILNKMKLELGNKSSKVRLDVDTPISNFKKNRPVEYSTVIETAKEEIKNVPTNSKELSTPADIFS